MRRTALSEWIWAGVWLALTLAASCAGRAAWAQGTAASGSEKSRSGKERPLPDKLPDRPTLRPTLSIPAEPLGFSPPGPIYLGQRWSLASLDFFDEDHLLFTFRVPGLIHRTAGDSADEEERQIRVVVLSLPTGAIEAEALWYVHDRARYLWMLKDGHFLLRDKDGVMEGDATLKLKPLLQFPGPLLSITIDPSQHFLVTNSREPVETAAKPGDVSSPSTAAASVVVDGEKPEGEPDQVLRILRRDSGDVMLVTRVRTSIHLPINADGYLESLRGNGGEWLLNLNYFKGGSRVLGRVDSDCSPTFDFISEQEVLVNTCASASADRLVALSTDGRRMWEEETASKLIWPVLDMAPGGSRLALETLAVTHSVNIFEPLGSDDIKGQLVRILDAANGNVVLATQASPVLDAGGNVALSPSGRRAAVLNAGAIQVFDLPVPAPLAGVASDHAAR
jgi:hypothetical protein